jgi:predicted GIY-YIG superfamily endonuclease
MYYVYLIRSVSFPNQIYIGYTQDINTRISDHNAGLSIHTSKYKPWELITYLCFKDQNKAIDFEKYLKSQSGRALAVKRFL